MKTSCIAFAILALTLSGETFRSGSCCAQEENQETKKEQKTQPNDNAIAIVGGDVHTVTGQVIRGGSILIKNGKIENVGQSIAIPENTKIIDAKGKIVTPGFVAINMSNVGVVGAPQNNDKLADSLNPFDRNIKFSLGVGITTGCLELSSGRGRGRRRNEGEPEERFLGLELPAQEFVTEAQLDYGDENTSLCPCCGLPILPTEPITPAQPTEAQPRKHAVVKMSFGKLENMLVKENAFYSPAPGALSGGAKLHNFRRDFKQAKQSADRAANASQSQGREGASRRTSVVRGPGGRTSRSGRNSRGGGNAELVRLAKKEVSMRATANTVDEIRDMIALAKELDFELVIEGGIEAWLVAAELSEAKVPVIYTPRSRRAPQPGQESSTGSSIESTGIFQTAGVPFATAALSGSVSMGGIAGRDLTSLPLEAAFAVRGGATNQTALQSLTIIPARMLGMDDRIGSIEKGKDADLLILNGQPLDYRTYVETALVDGVVRYERAKDRILPVFDRK